MKTFYVSGKKLVSWDRNIDVKEVEIGDPLTLEYGRIHIKSKKFDRFGNSEVMIVNHVRNKQTKERSLESITYYDDDSEVRGSLFGDKTWSVGPFDPSEYGNPVCFHTPGYQGTTIIVTTKMWEIDDPGIISSALDFAQDLLGLVKGNPLIEVIDTGLGMTSKVISGYIGHTELCSEHVMELRLDSDYPLIPGKYVCLPNMYDINDKKDILENYSLEDNYLVKNGKNDRIEEYDGTYFVLKVSNYERKELADFDFTSSSAELLQLVRNNSIDNVKSSLLDLNKDSYNLKLIELIKNSYDSWKSSDNNKYKLESIALYNQLSSSGMKEWFDDNFPDLVKELISPQ